MAISQKDNLQLIFQTPNDSRKYQNLKINPNVSVVFGFDFEEFITVQYEGVVKEAEERQVADFRNIHVSKNPKSAEYANLSKNKYFVISPKWVRYWNLKTNEKFELTF